MANLVQLKKSKGTPI